MEESNNKERKYLVWSNENDAWLAAPGEGFTKDLDKAGIYDEDYALGWLESDKNWLSMPPNTLFPAELAQKILQFRKDKAKDDADRFPSW